MRNLNPSAAHFSYPTCETTRHSPRGQLLHLNDATKKKGVPEHILYLLLCGSNFNVSINKIISENYFLKYLDNKVFNLHKNQFKFQNSSLLLVDHSKVD